MKILCLKQNVTDTATLDKGLALAKEWSSTVSLNLQFDFRITSHNFSSIPISTDVVKSGYIPNPTEIFQEAKATGVPFDVALLIYDWTKITPQPTNPADSGMCISIPIQWYVTYPEVLAEFLLHELCHYFYQTNGKLDRTHEYVAGFNTRKEWYLFLLKDLVKLDIPTYKYFSQKEVNTWKLVPELWEKLDTAREYAGIPFVITSGLRTGVHNEDVGGIADSSHLKGLAADIRARNSNEHYLITKGLILAGFTRISRKYPTHIHVDIDPSKPQNVLF